MRALTHLLVPSFVLLVGCGGPTQQAQAALSTVAEVLIAVDREVAPRYTAAADEAREHAGGWAEYDAAMHDWNGVEAALRLAHATILTTQAGLDGWRAGDQRGWLAAVPCLVVALDQLAAGLEVVGVHIEAMNQALALARAFAGRCEP